MPFGSGKKYKRCCLIKAKCATKALAMNQPSTPTTSGPCIVQLDAVPSTPCPCGHARRAFTTLPGAVASVHLVDISTEAKTHYHRHMTEIYVVIEGEGEIELDGERHPIRPWTAIYIPPGVRHRAIGKLKLLNIPVPPFDPNDEFED